MKKPMTIKAKKEIESAFILGSDNSSLPDVKVEKSYNIRSKQKTYSQTDGDVNALNILVDKSLAFKDENGFSIKLSKSAALRVAIEAAIILTTEDRVLFSSLLLTYGSRIR